LGTSSTFAILCLHEEACKSHFVKEFEMHDIILRMYVRLHDILSRDEGQDLVEYALVVALIAFGAIAGMNALSGGINSAFKTVSSKLISNI